MNYKIRIRFDVAEQIIRNSNIIDRNINELSARLLKIRRIFILAIYDLHIFSEIESKEQNKYLSFRIQSFSNHHYFRCYLHAHSRNFLQNSDLSI